MGKLFTWPWNTIAAVVLAVVVDVALAWASQGRPAQRRAAPKPFKAPDYPYEIVRPR